MPIRNQVIKVFGAALDPIDYPVKVLSKCSYINRIAQNLINAEDSFLDPYEGLLKYSKVLKADNFIKFGKFPISSWLTPRPDINDFNMINPKNFQTFVNQGGVLEYANELREFIELEIMPDIPLMIGVDHALTGGILKATAKKYGADKTLVIIFDAHFDAIPASISYDFTKYAKQNNEEVSSLINLDFIDEDLEVVNSYNCASYIDYLIKEKIISPENLIIFGCRDYPRNKLRSISDTRVKNYVDYYLSFEKRGVKFIPAEDEGELMIRKLKEILENCFIPYLYVSLDVDVCMYKEVLAARFMNAIGIEKSILLDAVKQLKKFMELKESRIIGMDLMEIETQIINKTLKKAGKKDKTVELVDEVLKILFYK